MGRLFRIATLALALLPTAYVVATWQPHTQDDDAPIVANAHLTQSKVSDLQLRQIIVDESRASYYRMGKPCACPDDRTKTGGRCGGNSAYIKTGGAVIYCKPEDVPDSIIQKHRARLGAI